MTRFDENDKASIKALVREMLKEELTIEIGKRRWMGDESSTVTVEVKLGGEVISSSDMYL